MSARGLEIRARKHDPRAGEDDFPACGHEFSGRGDVSWPREHEIRPADRVFSRRDVVLSEPEVEFRPLDHELAPPDDEITPLELGFPGAEDEFAAPNVVESRPI